MKPMFTCELDYTPNFHLMQIYAGLYALKNKGLIDLKVNFKKSNKNTLPLTTAVINNKYKVVYDCLDGLTWIPGNMDDNLAHFKNTYNVDFFFKRSYQSAMQTSKPAGCKVYPLGLNYNVQPDENLLAYNNSFKDKIEYLLKTNSWTSKVFGKRFYYAKDFEFPPLHQGKDKILFITRLWSPEEAKSEHSKHFRKHLNDVRIECIEACKKEYGKFFTGGIYREKYAEKNYPLFVMPDELTNKNSFLQSVKEHNICITTTGLHHSIGWKLAEYVAASRAIITEPLEFEVTGDFNEGKNYLQFTTAAEMLNKIEYLLSNKEATRQMMLDNYHYYNNYLKPENLVLNTFLKINEYEERQSLLLHAIKEKALVD